MRHARRVPSPVTGVVVRLGPWLGFGPQEVDGHGLFLFLAYLGFSLNCREEDSESGLEEPLQLLLNLLPIDVWFHQHVRGYDVFPFGQALGMQMMHIHYSGRSFQ